MERDELDHCLDLLDAADLLLVRQGHGILAARLSGIIESVREMAGQRSAGAGR